MEHGVKCMEHGVKCMEHGVECMEHGVKCMEHGVECMEHGVECMEHGVKCMEHGMICSSSKGWSPQKRHGLAMKRATTLKVWAATLPPPLGLPNRNTAAPCSAHHPAGVDWYLLGFAGHQDISSSACPGPEGPMRLETRAAEAGGGPEAGGAAQADAGRAEAAGDGRPGEAGWAWQGNWGREEGGGQVSGREIRRLGRGRGGLQGLMPSHTHTHTCGVAFRCACQAIGAGEGGRARAFALTHPHPHMWGSVQMCSQKAIGGGGGGGGQGLMPSHTHTPHPHPHMWGSVQMCSPMLSLGKGAGRGCSLDRCIGTLRVSSCGWLSARAPPPCGRAARQLTAAPTSSQGLIIRLDYYEEGARWGGFRVRV
eukprot:354805-Chlamydomonas_euryale.AAC.1